MLHPDAQGGAGKEDKKERASEEPKEKTVQKRDEARKVTKIADFELRYEDEVSDYEFQVDDEELASEERTSWASQIKQLSEERVDAREIGRLGSDCFCWRSWKD